jgi:hypothetical protein
MRRRPASRPKLRMDDGRPLVSSCAKTRLAVAGSASAKLAPWRGVACSSCVARNPQSLVAALARALLVLVVIADAEGLLNHGNIRLVSWGATYLLRHVHPLTLRRGQELAQAGLGLRRCVESCCY